MQTFLTLTDADLKAIPIDLLGRKSLIFINNYFCLEGMISEVDKVLIDNT